MHFCRCVSGKKHSGLLIRAHFKLSLFLPPSPKEGACKTLTKAWSQFNFKWYSCKHISSLAFAKPLTSSPLGDGGGYDNLKCTRWYSWKGNSFWYIKAAPPASTLTIGTEQKNCQQLISENLLVLSKKQKAFLPWKCADSYIIVRADTLKISGAL